MAAAAFETPPISRPREMSESPRGSGLATAGFNAAAVSGAARPSGEYSRPVGRGPGHGPRSGRDESRYAGGAAGPARRHGARCPPAGSGEIADPGAAPRRRRGRAGQGSRTANRSIIRDLSDDRGGGCRMAWLDARQASAAEARRALVDRVPGLLERHHDLVARGRHAPSPWRLPPMQRAGQRTWCFGSPAAATRIDLIKLRLLWDYRHRTFEAIVLQGSCQPSGLTRCRLSRSAMRGAVI